MINKVERKVDNKQRWYTKGCYNCRYFTGLSHCYKIRINKPIDKGKAKYKGYIGTERAVSAVWIKKSY